MGGQAQERGDGAGDGRPGAVSLGILSVLIVVANCSVCALVCFNKTLRTYKYIQIFRQVRRNLTMRKEFKSRREQRKERRRFSSDAQVAKVFCTVSTAFLLSWLPMLYSTTVYRVLKRPDLIPDVLYTISLFTLATSSLVNPLIYAFLKPDFRVLIRNFRQRNSPTKVVTKKPSIPSSSPGQKLRKKQGKKTRE